jgi:hypothetical protein
MNKLLIAKRCTILSALILGLAACGGGGGTPAAATTATTAGKYDPGIGKLIPEVRPNGYSARYTTDPQYKALIDAVTAGSAEVLGEVGGLIKWPFDIPAIFSGCGELNAFFGSNVDMHAYLKGEGVTDPALTFGNNHDGAVLVMCHELTEANVAYFLKPEVMERLEFHYSNTEATITEAVTLSLLMWEWQVMFHELGHGLDQMLLIDGDDSIKKQFRIPVANTCNSPTTPCDTIGEDFADWISSSIMISIIEAVIEEDPKETGKYLAGLITALEAWEGIFGAGGGAVHSKTVSRQVNMACYAFGGIEAIRTADGDSGNRLGNFLTTKGLDLNNCETSYTFNDNLTETLLGKYVDADTTDTTDTTDTPASGSGTESEPNNVAAAANTIVSTTTGAVNGSTGGPTGSDPQDYFKFTPTSSGSHTVTLTWTGAADLDLYVEDSSENQISSSATFNQPETVSINLTVGVAVLIKVLGFETSGAAVDYTLTIAQ